MKSMQELFRVLLQDIDWAERRIAQALVPLSDACEDPLLRSAFSVQRFDTREQIARLEKILQIVGGRSRGHHGDAIAGLLADADEVVARTTAGEVRDAGILEAAQTLEHHQIARYSTLVTLAERLGETEAARLLRTSLQEERVTVRLLDQVAGDGHWRPMQAA